MRLFPLMILALTACADGRQDLDGDGYCANADSCAGEALPGDCDDGEETISPAAPEWCDGLDRDCDGLVNQPSAIDADPWYVDADGDGFGDPSQLAKSCGELSGWSRDSTDCDDDVANTHPGAVDAPGDGVDADCDPSTAP